MPMVEPASCDATGRDELAVDMISWPFRAEPDTAGEFYFLSQEDRYTPSGEREPASSGATHLPGQSPQALAHGKQPRNTDPDEMARTRKRPRHEASAAGLDNAVTQATRQSSPLPESTARTSTAFVPAGVLPRPGQFAMQDAGNLASPMKIPLEEGINRALEMAIQFDDAQKVDRLIDIHQPNLDTALLTAARLGKAKVVALLLRRGASINASDEAVWTALKWAVCKGHHEVVIAIVERAPGEINRPGPGGISLLHFAVQAGCEKTVLELLQRGANPNACDYRGYNALHVAMLVNATASHAITGDLVKYGVNASALTLRGESFVALAASSRMAVIPPELESIARQMIDLPDCVGRTPLMWACTMGNGAMARQLLRLGADRGAVGPAGKTARDIAVESGYADMVAILDKPGAGTQPKPPRPAPLPRDSMTTLGPQGMIDASPLVFPPALRGGATGKSPLEFIAFAPSSDLSSSPKEPQWATRWHHTGSDQ
jgi:ankyrin repeat protein